MDEDERSERRERNPASRAERILSILSLGCIVASISGIAGVASGPIVLVGILIGIIVMHMTCFRLGLRLPAELSFLFVFPLFAILAALLFPMFSNIRNHAQQSSCAGSMKMIGRAIESYCEDWDGRLPPGDRWNDLILREEMNNFRDFCPSAPGDLPSYALNGRLEGKRMDEIPRHTVLLFECRPGRNRSGGPELLPPGNMHPKGINILFADGRVKAVHHSEIRKLRWRP